MYNCEDLPRIPQLMKLRVFVDHSPFQKLYDYITCVHLKLRRQFTMDLSGKTPAAVRNFPFLQLLIDLKDLLGAMTLSRESLKLEGSHNLSVSINLRLAAR